MNLRIERPGLKGQQTGKADGIGGLILRLLLAAFVLMGGASCAASGAVPNRPLRTENVFLIVSDGLRWQEVFNGAEQRLIDATNGGVKNVQLLRTNFWRATPELRRAALMPFLWSEVAVRGQIYGNREQGSAMTLANTRKFSYPGYNELLTGYADPAIDSNDKKPNPNVTVFEWLAKDRRFRNRTAAFGTWDRFPYIFNVERSGIPVWPTWEEKFANDAIAPNPKLLAVMRDTTEVFEGVILDSFLFHAALDHIRQRKPRLAFISFGETDEWGHAGRYDLYLNAAHNVDRHIQRLWQTVQSIPQYRGKTTFLITTDHGRGSGRREWKDHGENIKGAEDVWLAVLGPDTPNLGERFHTAPIQLNQVAATIAALLGRDYAGAFRQAGPPVTDVWGAGHRARDFEGWQGSRQERIVP